MCGGKFYYDLLKARSDRGANDVAILRLEQLYPFPRVGLKDLLLRFPGSAEVAWVQEEPRNMGPWRVMNEFIQPLLDPSRRRLHYIGRTDSASPAAGSYKRHDQEQKEILEACFAPELASPVKRMRVVKTRKSS